MSNIMFFYDNEWDKVSDVVPCTEHANFLAENTQLRDFNHPWKSRYGAGSGWGKFGFGATNNKIYFKDSGATARIATLASSTYSADELCTQIKTQMEAVCSDTFTITYYESGSNQCKFNIKDNTGAFELTCTLTTNAAWDTIGFSTAANKTGADNYTADYIRLHTNEYLIANLGSAKGIRAFFVKYHNIQSGASINLIQGNASNSWGAPSLSRAVTYGSDIMGYIWSSNQTHQWWRHVFCDKDNPDYHLYEGRVFLGPGFQPVTNFLSKSRVSTSVDPSIIKRSEGGQKSTIQLNDYGIWSYRFKVKGSSEVSNFQTMLDTVKKSKAFWICENPDNFPAKTYYCQITDYEWIPIRESSDYWELSIQVEEEV